MILYLKGFRLALRMCLPVARVCACAHACMCVCVQHVIFSGFVKIRHLEEKSESKEIS